MNVRREISFTTRAVTSISVHKTHSPAKPVNTQLSKNSCLQDKPSFFWKSFVSLSTELNIQHQIRLMLKTWRLRNRVWRPQDAITVTQLHWKHRAELYSINPNLIWDQITDKHRSGLCWNSYRVASLPRHQHFSGVWACALNTYQTQSMGGGRRCRETKTRPKSAHQTLNFRPCF